MNLKTTKDNLIHCSHIQVNNKKINLICVNLEVFLSHLQCLLLNTLYLSDKVFKPYATTFHSITVVQF